MYEIELKAWLTKETEQNAENVLNKIGIYDGITDKRDTYWHKGAPSCTQKVRIRSQICTNANNKELTKQTLITLKNKEAPGKIEVNEEIEFAVVADDAEKTFAIFLQILDFAPKETKHKTTKNWRVGDYHVEVAKIENLGTFLEIETLAKNNDEKTVKKCKEGLYEILAKCGVNENAVEERYYTSLLKERAQKNE